MEYSGLVLGFVGLLVANITVFPAFSKRYPAATPWLNVLSATLNSASGLAALLVYKAKAAIAVMTPSSTPGRFLRASFFASLVGAIVTECVGFTALIWGADFVRWFGLLIVLAGAVTIVRIVRVLIEQSGSS